MPGAVPLLMTFADSEVVRLAPRVDAAWVSQIAKRPPCPECESVLTYNEGSMFICPECGHEWTAAAPVASKVVRDSVGHPLTDGDTVTVIKDLKIKGSSLVVKRGTKVKNIRIVDGDHDIDCRIEGIGAMGLKSEFVKKA